MNYFICIESKLDFFRVLIIAHKMGFRFNNNKLIDINEFSESIYIYNNSISYQKDKALFYSNIYSSDFIRKFDDYFSDITIPSLDYHLNLFNNQIIMSSFKFPSYLREPISFNILHFPHCLSLREDYLFEIILQDVKHALTIFQIINLQDFIHTILLYLKNFNISLFKKLYIDNREELLLNKKFHIKHLKDSTSNSSIKLLLDRSFTSFFNSEFSLSSPLKQLDFEYEHPLYSFFDKLF